MQLPPSWSWELNALPRCRVRHLVYRRSTGQEVGSTAARDLQLKADRPTGLVHIKHHSRQLKERPCTSIEPVTYDVSVHHLGPTIICRRTNRAVRCIDWSRHQLQRTSKRTPMRAPLIRHTTRSQLGAPVIDARRDHLDWRVPAYAAVRGRQIGPQLCAEGALGLKWCVVCLAHVKTTHRRGRVDVHRNLRAGFIANIRHCHWCLSPVSSERAEDASFANTHQARVLAVHLEARYVLDLRAKLRAYRGVRVCAADAVPLEGGSHADGQ